MPNGAHPTWKAEAGPGASWWKELIVGFEAWLTLAVIVLGLVALVRDVAPPDAVFVGSVVVFLLFGIIDPAEAFSGFSNPGVLTVGALFIVAGGLQSTGVLEWLGHRLLGAVNSEKGVLGRLAVMVVPLSAFLNNTPIVVMLIPIVVDWCRKRGISPSKLLMPLSHLAILGGVCTLIGTSTNLIVHGKMIESDQAGIDGGLGMFELSKIGIPFAVVGILYLFLVGRRLLPERKELIEQFGEAKREYVVEMLVQPGCRLAGQPVEAAGLRSLTGLFLIEIDRQDRVITPVGPTEVIQAGDRLVFTGVVDTIVDLEKIPGFVPAADSAYEVDPRLRHARRLTEAVISPTSPLIGKTVRDSNFRSLYDAAIVAVHRGGVRLPTKIGDISLRSGDTLLLQTGPDFIRLYRNHPDFYLVSEVEGFLPLRHDRAPIAIALFAALVILMTTGLVEIVVAAFLIGGLMVATRCLGADGARRTIHWQVLVTIAAAFGVANALDRSGAAGAISGLLVDLVEGMGMGAFGALTVLYVMTSLLTAMITNNAAAVLMFPIFLQTALLFGADARPFMVGLALAASTSFMSPIGYQTNMMVYGPGGYRFTDFVRVGFPLHLILLVVVMGLIKVFYPL